MASLALALRRSVAGAFLSSPQLGRQYAPRASFSPKTCTREGQIIIASSSRSFASVTGVVYEPPAKDGDETNAAPPQVTLFTKEGCTLCDKVKDILYELKDEIPHGLAQIDITDEENRATYFAKYKYDIPVLHMNGQYWVKHRTTLEEAREGLMQATREGSSFEARPGEPNAEAKEH